MMRKSLLITIVVLSSAWLNGQTPVGSWSDHLSYNSVDCIALSEGEVFASTGASIIIYDKLYSELKKMTRINGLTETSVKNIAWSAETGYLIIAYSSTNIDLVKNNVIYNIPDISRKYIAGKKEINRIRTDANYAYMACSFGIVVTDLNRKEIFDTWKPGTGSETNEVWDIAFGNGKIFAATETGIFSADITNQGLSYFGNWDRIDLLPEAAGKYTCLVYSGGKLYANLTDPRAGGDQIFVIDGISGTLFSFQNGVYNKSFDNSPEGFTIASSGSARYYSINGSLVKTISSYGWGNPKIFQAIADNGDIWIADKDAGLIRGENMTEFDALTLPGPVSNNAFNITSFNGKTVICGGAATESWLNQGLALEVSIFENNNWDSITSKEITDPLRSLIDRGNINHFFVSTWGGGLLEYDNNILVKQYTESNSPLQTIIPGRPLVNVCGLAMDQERNLWLTQTGVPGSIKTLRPDGTWIVNPLTIDAPIIGDIIITSHGHKWIILPGGYGLFVFDDNNTPETFSDDRYKKMQVQDTENQIISNVYSLAEDFDGNIWAGTDQGPVIYFNPQSVFDSNLKASRIKIPRNDGTNLADYMLKTETITSISVDGANRKWLGTESSGAYLLSPDGTVQVENFNDQNSPLLSNSVLTLAIDNKTGDVWFGTSMGAQSYRGNATSGGEKFTNVYSFPNPVREDFTGNVTITGLIRDTQIRITDISGNLVYETVSDGGQASWDLSNYRGNRVATGVYLIFCASKDGSQATVTKILVIK